MFKKLANKITNILIENEIIEKNEFEIYTYGFEMLIYFIVNISIALFIGIIFNKFIHTIIFLSCYCTLRQFTGGYHARNYIECTLTFVLIYLSTIFISNNIYIDKYILIFMLISSIIIIYKISPLEHRNKPLNIDEKKHYKKIATKLTLVISSISILCIEFNIFKEYIIFSLFAIVWITILLFIQLIMIYIEHSKVRNGD